MSGYNSGSDLLAEIRRLQARLSALERPRGMAFDEVTDEQSTSSASFVSLGGPKVSVTVGQSGLVAIFAHVELKQTSGSGGAHVALYESVLGTQRNIFRTFDTAYTDQWLVPGSAVGATSSLSGSWLVHDAAPGHQDYELQYKGGASTEASFRDRQLWVVSL